MNQWDLHHHPSNTSAEKHIFPQDFADATKEYFQRELQEKTRAPPAKNPMDRD
jgi:hypothetical protein